MGVRVGHLGLYWVVFDPTQMVIVPEPVVADAVSDLVEIRGDLLGRDAGFGLAGCGALALVVPLPRPLGPPRCTSSGAARLHASHNLETAD